MERRHFLKVAFGFAAGAVAIASAAKVVEAAPLAPQSLVPQEPHESGQAPQPALATQDDLDQAHVEQVRWRRRWGFRRRWHRRRHWGWRRRHRGGHRRRWHFRFW